MPFIPENDLIVAHFRLSFANGVSLTLLCRGEVAYSQLAQNARLAGDASVTTRGLHLSVSMLTRENDE